MEVCIRGKMTDDDGLRIDMPRREDQAWYNVPLPQCPDCGGDLIWDEAGNVPGTRRCAGKPVSHDDDGRPSYAADGGCGSIYSVQTKRGQVWLQRERFC